MMGHAPARMAPPRDALEARRNWVGWVLWYMQQHPEEVPTKTALAKRLRVAKSALTPLLDPDGTRAPAFETLLASSELTGFPIDVLISSPPPSGGPVPRKRH
jgi:hypothetical protein